MTTAPCSLPPSTRSAFLPTRAVFGLWTSRRSALTNGRTLFLTSLGRSLYCRSWSKRRVWTQPSGLTQTRRCRCKLRRRILIWGFNVVLLSGTVLPRLCVLGAQKLAPRDSVHLTQCFIGDHVIMFVQDIQTFSVVGRSWRRETLAVRHRHRDRRGGVAWSWRIGPTASLNLREKGAYADCRRHTAPGMPRTVALLTRRRVRPSCPSC